MKSLNLKKVLAAHWKKKSNSYKITKHLIRKTEIMYQ